MAAPSSGARCSCTPGSTRISSSDGMLKRAERGPPSARQRAAKSALFERSFALLLEQAHADRERLADAFQELAVRRQLVALTLYTALGRGERALEFHYARRLLGFGAL